MWTSGAFLNFFLGLKSEFLFLNFYYYFFFFINVYDDSDGVMLRV